MFRSNIALFFLLLVFALSTPAKAELPPGAYENLLKQAQEVYVLELTNLKKVKSDDTHSWFVASARVIEIVRSKKGATKGDLIEFSTYTVEEDVPGPTRPPMLKKGWRGMVWLNPSNTEEEKAFASLTIAAYGKSFEELTKP